MIKTRIVPAMVLVLLAVTLTPSCFKGTTVDLNSDLEITRAVSFASDVNPILQKSCSLSGCHSSNGIAPDLSADKAFLSLTTSDYLDINNPENSELYGFVSGKITPAMPIGGADPAISAMILAWIKQGAQNN
ncbi:MAG: hypothetical protein RIQ78_498 [Bacteroidota bacterium]